LTIEMAGHVVRMKEGWSVFKILTDTQRGKRPLGNLDVDERTILE